MAHGAHRWSRVALRELLLAFLLCAAVLPAAAQYKAADCPACADLIGQLDRANRIYDLMFKELRSARSRLDELTSEAENRRLSSKDQERLARQTELVKTLQRNSSEQAERIDRIDDQLVACMKKNCPEQKGRRPEIPPLSMVKSCPACAARANSLNAWLRTERTRRAELQWLDYSMEAFTAKALQGPLTDADKQGYQELRKQRDEASRDLEHASRSVRIARIALAACERRACAPVAGSTPGTGEGAGPTPAPCPACNDLAAKVDGIAAKLEALHSEADALGKKLETLISSNRFDEWRAAYTEHIEVWKKIRSAEGDLLEAQDKLDECARKNCPPVAKPPPGGGTGATPGETPPKGPATRCPACADKQKQLDAKQAELEGLRKSFDTLSASLQAISSKVLDGKATDKDKSDYREGVKKIGELDAKIKAAGEEIDRLKGELKSCEKDKCPAPSGTGMVLPGGNLGPGGYLAFDTGNFTVETVRNVAGNNPFDPQNPLGGFVSVTPVAPGTCTTSQPPAQTRTQSCPPGQTGSITETSTYACVGTTWTPGPFIVTGNTCTSGPPPGCTTPQPPTETQTLPCPAGQTGLITQARTYSCVGTTWTAGPFVTTSNTCTTPPPPVSGCATAFGSGNYSCSGSCGIGSVGLSVTPGSNSMTANPFGANSNVAFTCLNQNALSVSNNLTILGAPGHTCNLSGLGASSLGIQCRNNGGGSCSSSCSR